MSVEELAKEVCQKSVDKYADGEIDIDFAEVVILNALKSYAAAEVDAAVRAENERCAKVVDELTICLGGTTYEIRKQFINAIRLSKLEKESQ